MFTKLDAYVFYQVEVHNSVGTKNRYKVYLNVMKFMVPVSKLTVVKLNIII